MAMVYRAAADQSQGEVALKISRLDQSDPRFGNALKQEVDILKPLSHPGVVRVLPVQLSSTKRDVYLSRAVDVRNQPWYYVMEYLLGGSLKSLIDDIGIMPFTVSCTIAVRLIDALKYIHSRGIAHLDVKPANILFRYKHEPRALIDPVLIDFGIAARTKKVVRPRGGSLHVMAPEHLQETRGVIPPEIPMDMEKMDIYSLGVVTYRMWTTRYPFEGITESSITSAILRSDVRPPSEVNSQLPPQADAFMMRWLAKDPQVRPDLDELRRYMDFWSQGMLHFPEMTKNKPSKMKFWKK